MTARLAIGSPVGNWSMWWALKGRMRKHVTSSQSKQVETMGHTASDLTAATEVVGEVNGRFNMAEGEPDPGAENRAVIRFVSSSRRGCAASAVMRAVGWANP